MHVAYGVEVDKTTNTRNYKGHEQRQLIDAVRKVNLQVSSFHPRKHVDHNGFAMKSSK